jgi:hypothetical protein
MAGGGNQSKATTTSTTQQQQTRGPIPGTEGLWSNVWQMGNRALGQTNNNPFMGNFVAQPGQDAQSGLNMLRGIVPMLGRGAEDVINLGQRTARGDFLSPDSNPFIRQVAEASLRPITEQLQQNVLPGITDQSISQGAYGGARQDLSQERAVKDWSQTGADATSRIYANNYANERQLQQGAPGMLAAGYQLAAAPGQAMLSIDDLARGLEQMRINNQLAQHQEQQSAPWYGLNQQANLLSAGNFYNGSGTSSTTADNPNYVDPFTQMLKMAIGGTAAVAGIGGKGGFNLWGG